MSNASTIEGRTVLQVIPQLDAGGAERTVLEVAEALVEAGANALVVSAGGRMVDDLLGLGAEHIAMPVDTKAPLALWQNAGRLAALIRERGVDIVHARSRAPAWSARAACQRTEARFVTTYHGAYSGTLPLKRAYNAIMAKGDRVIANSDWTARHIQQVHGVTAPRVVTIPRGVDMEMFDPDRVSADRVKHFRQQFGAASEDVVFLLPGRLTEWKGQRLAIEALAQLPADLLDRSRLVLMGDAQGRDTYVDAIKGDIARLRLVDRVKVLPHQADMPAALMAADIVLTPSTRPEAFGRTAAEASAMARPVIVSDHGGAVDVIGHKKTGLRVAPADINSLRTAMAQILDMTSQAQAALGQNGRKRIMERFTKHGLQKATLGVYEDLLSERREQAA